VATAGPIGLDGLTDRSRRPYRHANQLLTQIETLIVRLKQDKPSWGAPKIRERLARLYPDVHTPAISTVHVVLDRHGLVKRAKHRQHLSAVARSMSYQIKYCFIDERGLATALKPYAGHAVFGGGCGSCGRTCSPDRFERGATK
jgi:Homeodomain-like domain